MTVKSSLSSKRLRVFLLGSPVISILSLILSAPRGFQCDDALGQNLPITSSGLGTQISPPINNPGGQIQYNITGGTRPGGGGNLFHSFGNFNVPNSNIANFLNETGLPTSNILGRVTGGNVSNIFGTIQTTGYGNANLFLMNPAGIIFGQTATLNVGGMATFTTADYLKLADGTRFNAVPNIGADALLSASPVAAFGFLGANPAAITVQGSQLTVAQGAGISLVGGNVTVEPTTLSEGTIQTAKLSASGGQVNIASAAGPGEVSATTFEPQGGMNLGAVTLSQGSVLDVSGNAGGTVRIRGGSLVMDTATISADSIDANGASIAIDVNVTGNVSISAIDAPALTARTTGSGNAGNIQISSGSMDVMALPIANIFSAIDTHTSGLGNAGNVTINTGDLTAAGFFVPFINTGTSGTNPGRGGDVTIAAHNIQLQDLSITTGNFLAFLLGEGGTGTSGNVSITADSLQMIGGSQIITDSVMTDLPIGTAGNVTINAHSMAMDGSSGSNPSISSAAQEHGGIITINADVLSANNASIRTQTNDGAGGSLTVTSKSIELTNGSSLVSSTGGNGDGGSVTIVATDHVSILESLPEAGRPSGIFTISDGTFGTAGKAGNVSITTPRLEMVGGGRIDTSTATSGRGGDVTIHATNSISMSGETDGLPIEPLFNLGSLQPSGIYTRTVGTNCSGICGNAGKITIDTGTLTIGAGSQINSGTSSSGQGGGISINAADTIAISGTLSTGQPGGIQSRTISTDSNAGSGGNIILNAGQSVSISEGAAISASTTGPGNAGNVTIEGLASPTQSVLINGTGSGIFTNTEGSGVGGNIFIHADSVTLQNGAQTSAATSGPGRGGTIEILATNAILLKDAATTDSNSNSLLEDAGSAGTIRLNASNIDVQSAIISASTVGPGSAGDILLEANSVSLGASEMGRLTEQGADLFTRTTGPGHAGNITIVGRDGPASQADNVTITGFSRVLSESAFGLSETQGNAGNISVLTSNLALTENSQLSTSSLSSTGTAGNITIAAADQVVVGSNSKVSSESIEFASGNGGRITLSAPTILIENGGRVTTNTDFSGNAGDIQINSNDLQITSSGQITSSSVINQGAPDFPPTGSAGLITIQGLASPAQSILIDGAGSRIITTAQGSGAGGDITLSAQAVTLQNGGQVSSSSTGTGTAGNVTITANQTFTAANSSVTTEATRSSGGVIKITTDPSGMVELSNSTISASVLDGTGGGGNVSIDPQFVILQNSQILARAQQGPGGNILINITNGGLFLPDATSVVSAQSGNPALNGTVTIQSPNAPAGGKIQPLGQAPLQVTALLTQRCAAIARGEVSSFVVAGRDSLPSEPGGWLTSPLAFGPTDSGSTVQARGPVMSTLSKDSMVISLRRLPSSWTIARRLDDDWLSGCAS